MRGRQGFTLIEVVIACSLTAVLALTLVPSFRQPLHLKRAVVAAEYQQNALHAMDIIINDLKEAYPMSIPWTTLPPALGAPINTITFQKANFEPDPANPTFNTIVIAYDPVGRRLQRTDTLPNGTSQTTNLVQNLDPPSTSNPLFQIDPQPDVYHVVMVTLLYTPPDSSPQRMVRRVAAKG